MPDRRPVSFRDYVATRRYHHGRGSREGWAFVAYALGDGRLPDPDNWEELRRYLLAEGADRGLLEAARIVWRSYLSHVSRARRMVAAAARGRPMAPPELQLL